MSHPQTATVVRQPQSLNDLILSAQSLEASGHEQEAVELYQRWLPQGQDERKYLAWFHYGWLLQKLNRVDEAVSAHQQLAANYANYLSTGQALAA